MNGCCVQPFFGRIPLAYQHWEEWRRYLVVSRPVLVVVQHEESEERTEQAHTELSHEEDHVPYDVHLTNAQYVVHNQPGCELRSFAESFPCSGNLH